MGILRRLWLRRQAKVTADAKLRNDALLAVASHPVRPYLIALMDDLVRQGIYLNSEQQVGARFAIDLLTKEIQKGDALLKKK